MSWLPRWEEARLNVLRLQRGGYWGYDRRMDGGTTALAVCALRKAGHRPGDSDSNDKAKSALTAALRWLLQRQPHDVWDHSHVIKAVLMNPEYDQHSGLDGKASDTAVLAFLDRLDQEETFAERPADGGWFGPAYPAQALSALNTIVLAYDGLEVGKRARDSLQKTIPTVGEVIKAWKSQGEKPLHHAELSPRRVQGRRLFHLAQLAEVSDQLPGLGEDWGAGGIRSLLYKEMPALIDGTATEFVDVEDLIYWSTAVSAIATSHGRAEIQIDDAMIRCLDALWTKANGYEDNPLAAVYRFMAVSDALRCIKLPMPMDVIASLTSKGAMGHPVASSTRLTGEAARQLIVQTLATSARPLRAYEISSRTGISAPRVSEHLGTLLGAGLIQKSSPGRFAKYAVTS